MISDYDKGYICQSDILDIIEPARFRGIPIFVDSKKHKRYASFTWSVCDLLLNTVNPPNSSCVTSDDVALLICPQIISGLRCL